MRPREYEELVAQTLRSEGWAVELTTEGGDYGVDLFASRDGQRVAVQAKMYGGTNRKINRAVVMQLHGAAAYFGCATSLLATNGRLLPDAQEVADRLGIQVRSIAGQDAHLRQPPPDSLLSFDTIWETYVLPLAGVSLDRTGGRSNQVLRVDWTGIERCTSNGNVRFIEIEIFRRVIHRLLAGETVTRAEINDEYPGRASSGIVLILSQVPLFELMSRPAALRLRMPTSS